MGFFSSKKKTYVASVTQRLLDDEGFRTSSQYGITRYMQEQKSVLSPRLGGISVSDTLVDAINASMPSKMRKVYRWASKEGNYIYGVPDSRVAVDEEGDLSVTLMNHLRGKEAAAVTLIDSTQNSKNLYHAGWMKLVDMLGYSGANNELTLKSMSKGTECYLYDGVLQLTERTREDLVLDDNYEHLGLAMTYGKCFDREEDISRVQQADVIGLSDQLTITYAYKQDNDKPNIPVVNVFNTTGIKGYADIGTIVRFTDDQGAIQEVSTDSSGLFEFTAPSETTVSGTFISLGGAEESSSINHTYPYENATPVTEPPPLYYIEYEDQVISLADINPEIDEGDIIPDEYLYIQAVYEVDGVYKWFSYAHLSGGIPSLDGAADYSADVGKYFPRFYLRQDAQDLIDRPKTDEGRKDTETMFKKLSLKLKDITETVNKAIGDVSNEIKFSFLQMCISINNDKDVSSTGEYIFNYFNRLHAKGLPIPETEDNEVRGTGKEGVSQRIADKIYVQQISYASSWKKVIDGVVNNNNNVPLKKGEYCVKFSEGSTKLTIDNGNFKIVRVPNVHSIFHQLSETQYVKIEVHEITLRHMFYGQTVTSNGGDENLTIPLDYDIVYGLKTSEKEELMNKSLQLTVTTLKVVKSKWYQRGAFKFLMAVVSIAINVIVPGSGLTLMALLQAVAVTVVTGLIVNAAIGLIVKLAVALGFSPEGLLGLIAVLVVAAAFVTSGSSLNQTLLSAKNMMKVVNTSFDIYQKHIQANITQIKKSMDTFNKYAADQWKKLKETQKLLNTGVIPVDLELLARPIENNQIYFGESAEDFYTRTTTVDVSEMTTDIVGFLLQATTSPPVPKRYEPERSMEVDDVLLIN